MPTDIWDWPPRWMPVSRSVFQAFTYDALGRMLTSTDPLSRVTTYSYYSNSTDFSDPSVTSDASFDSVSLLLHGDGANNSIVIADKAVRHPNR